MKKIKSVAFAALCCLAVCWPMFITVGCQTSAPPTKEAIKYFAFKDTWTAAHTAYQGYCEQVVQGKVSAKDEAEIDKVWNSFRVAFKISLQAANKDWSAATPDSVVKIKDNLVIIIRSAL